MKTVRNVVCAMFVIAALCSILRSPEKAKSLIETSSLKQVEKVEKSKDVVVLELAINATFPQQEQPRPLSTKNLVQK